MKIEHLILKNLLHNEEYVRGVLPFIKSEYFKSPNEKILYKFISSFINEYKKKPSIEAIKIVVSESKKIKKEDAEEICNLLDTWKTKENTDTTFLIKQTEAFCKEKALHNAMLESIKIITDEKDNRDKGIVPELLKEALSIAFDPAVGHDLLEDAAARYDFYHKVEEKIPFDIDNLNKITDGGLSRKTLNILVAGVNVGKSLAMCHMAASNLLHGKKVLYITCEMAEERIAERIDANILDVSIDTLRQITKEQFLKLISKLKTNTVGDLIIKEYPTGTANANHFRYLIHELALKKGFIPDIIYIDYLNICSSSRLKNNGSTNSYTLVKSIAEEIRALAVELNVPIVTATQLTREGSVNSDANMTHVSESFGTVATADLILALINTENLERLGQIMFKQLKNRYTDVTKNKKFLVGIDRSKMRLYDIGDIPIDGSGNDETEEIEYTSPFKGKSNKGNFSDFKF